MKFQLKQTCGACPEQYDGQYVGFMRLRHGSFRVECRGQTVYTANPKGDGIFECDERDYYLNMGCEAIKRAMEEQPEEKLFVIDYGDEEEGL